MKRQTFNEINITPLTDIFLVLLIIMMVVAPILDQQGLKLTIPDYVEESAIQNKEQKIYFKLTTWLYQIIFLSSTLYDKIQQF